MNIGFAPKKGIFFYLHQGWSLVAERKMSAFREFGAGKQMYYEWLSQEEKKWALQFITILNTNSMTKKERKMQGCIPQTSAVTVQHRHQKPKYTPSAASYQSLHIKAVVVILFDMISFVLSSWDLFTLNPEKDILRNRIIKTRTSDKTLTHIHPYYSFYSHTTFYLSIYL